MREFPPPPSVTGTRCCQRIRWSVPAFATAALLCLLFLCITSVQAAQPYSPSSSSVIGNMLPHCALGSNTYSDGSIAYPLYQQIATTNYGIQPIGNLRVVGFKPTTSFQKTPFVWSIWSYRSVLCSQYGGTQTLMSYGYQPTSTAKYVQMSYQAGQQFSEDEGWRR